MDDKLSMPTHIDIKNRAKKQYHSSKNGMKLVIRELMSNAFHAILIQKPENPLIELTINESNNSLILKDNGCGFSERDKEAIKTLDKESEIKKEHNLPSKGEGRLVLIHFGENTHFSTVSQSKEGNICLSFDYPQPEEKELFEDIHFTRTEEAVGTEVMVILRDNIFSTFINHFKSIESIVTFLKEEYLYFFIELENLIIKVNYQDKSENINKDLISKLDRMELDIMEEDTPYPLYIYLIDNESSKGLYIRILAHSVLVDNISTKIAYKNKIENVNKICYISSPYFDKRVATGGLTIELDTSIVEQINSKLSDKLDEKFAPFILEQRKSNLENYQRAQKNLEILSRFLPEQSTIDGLLPKSPKDYKQEALRNYSDETYEFLTNKKPNSPVIDTALYLYVKHRAHIIESLKKMTRRYNEEGEKISVLENEFHDLFFKRGTKTDDNEKDYLKHNLWLIDDKLASFSAAHSTTASSKTQSDVYLYLDNTEGQPNEVIIIELKRPLNPNASHDAHNVKEMIRQTKNYAEDYMSKKEGYQGQAINPEKSRFHAYIIASTPDILAAQKEDGTCHRIVFLNNSYYTDKKIGENQTQSIRIELLSYDDLLMIATQRNKIFSEFLKKARNHDY